MRAAAMLHGLAGWGGEDFHYLELGCGNGANLLALANRFPAATFVGVEKDEALVRRAVARAEGCELGNVRFVLGDLKDFQPESGAFDFAVAHGVYSWVESDVAEALLGSMARALSPAGVCLISYNTLPGWSIRGLVRDVMKEAAGNGRPDEDRLRSARSRIGQLHRLIAGNTDPYSSLLATELANAAAKSDGYLLGEHLGDRNEPIYVREFLRRAALHDLQLVAELLPATGEGALENELAAAMQGGQRVEVEQTLDLISYRQLRATLLCRNEIVVRAKPDHGAAVIGGQFLGKLAPLAEEPLLGPGKTLRFKTQNGAEIEAHQPLLKAAMLALSMSWPSGLSVEQLISTAFGLLRERGFGQSVAHDEVEGVIQDLVLLASRRLIEILPFLTPVYRTLDECPRLSNLTRLEATRDGVVTNSAHEPVMLAEPTRTIAGLLDGERDIKALVLSLEERVNSGEFALSERAAAADRRSFLARLVSQAVAELGGQGLLVPADGKESPEEKMKLLPGSASASSTS